MSCYRRICCITKSNKFSMISLVRFTYWIALVLISIMFHTSCKKKNPVILDNEVAVVIPIKPHGIPQSTNYTVWVNDDTVFTGQAGNESHKTYSFCTFDFSGSVTVRVNSEISIRTIDILPTSKEISYTILDSKTVEFTLQRPEMITLKLNDSNNHTLHFLTSHPETDRPDPENTNVLYYAGPGEYDVGILELASNQTLYIEAGAKLNGMVLIKDAQNVKVKGRGMIDGTYNEFIGNHPEGDAPWRLVYMVRSQNIVIEGITLYNSRSWTIHPYSCNNLWINNIRILNWEYGSDGTDISACQEVKITDSFYRTNDDPIAIKALSFAENAFYPNPMIQNMDVKNILVEGCTIWNMSWGNVFEIGYELRCNRVSDITFRNCDAIRQGGRGAVFSIHNADVATVENVLYEDIRVENAEAGMIGCKLFDLAIFYSLFSYDSDWGDIKPNEHWDNLLPERGIPIYRGKISNIIYRNIQVMDGNFPYSIFHGYDQFHTIESVLFENITIGSTQIENKDELKLEINEYVENVQFN